MPIRATQTQLFQTLLRVAILGIQANQELLFAACKVTHNDLVFS